MRTVDDFARIRQLHRDGVSARQIAKQLGIGRDTVRKALAHAEPPPYTRAPPRAAPVFGPFAALVDAILEADRTAPRKQRHTASQIFRRLVKDHDCTGGYDQVRRHLKSRRQAARDAFVPLDHPPGHRCEADFGHIHIDFPDGRRLVPVLVMTWSYSNAPFALAPPTERTEAILHGMSEAFAFFGHVPHEAWWDNPTTVAIHIHRGRERTLHSRYAALAGHFPFAAKFCLPRTAREKPRVENRVKDLERMWATPVPVVAGLAALNAHLRQCCVTARERTCGGNAETVAVRFDRDRAAALPLPRRPFDACVIDTGAVDKYQTVAFDGNRYGVPRRWAFRAVTVKGGAWTASIRSPTAASWPRTGGAMGSTSGCWIRRTSWRFWPGSRRPRTVPRRTATGPCRPSSLHCGPASRPTTRSAPASAGTPARRHCRPASRSPPSRPPSPPPWPAGDRRPPPSPPPPSGWRLPPHPCPTPRCPPSPFRGRTCHGSAACCPATPKERPMTDPNVMLLNANLKQLKLPTMLAEHDKLAREAAERDEPYHAHLLRLTELEVTARTANAVAARVRAAGFPVHEEFDVFDFTALPSLPKQKVLELTRREWVDQHFSACLIGGSGTGKTHVMTAAGLSLCRLGVRVRFVTAANLVTELETAQQEEHRPDRLLAALDRVDLLIVDELGYLSFSRVGAELLFQVFAERYERRSLLVAGNLPFGEWGTAFQGERMTAALLDRLTHRCHPFDMSGESYRFRESMKAKDGRPAKTAPKTKK